MTDDYKLYWIWLADKFGIASKEFPSFAHKLRDPYDVYRLEAEEIEQIEGISDRTKARLCDKSLEGAYNILKYCKKYHIDIIGYNDDRYPSRLRTIENPPVLLYCMGKLPDMNNRLCIGVVGTRKMSEYGKRSAYKISYELGAANVCVVSGMALGIDGVSACGALESGGETVAVLGCGLSIVYPKEHARLMKAIASGGAVVSEYPPFERPLSGNFPKRNRIISGLCNGVIIIEGAKGSGALITASRAIGQGRELFALPGKVGESNSEGPNELIKDGANVVLCARDVVTHYDFLYHDAINYGKLTRSQTRSELDDKILKKYGVSSLYQRATYEAPVREDIARETVSMGSVSTPVPKEKTSDILREDNSAKALDGLDAGTRHVYELLPDGTAFTPDTIAANGVDIGDVIMSLTMLEIADLVSSLPGGMYIKK